MINVDEDGDATPHTIEVPYQARETILNMLNKSIYSDAMGLDTSILAGGSLTNVAMPVFGQNIYPIHIRHAISTLHTPIKMILNSSCHLIVFHRKN